MLTHLPGRTSQPSRKGITSNILILRCSFHKTAKRLSITGLTHLLRLRSKNTIQIVRHLSSIFPTKKKRKTIWTSFCATLTGTNLSLLLTGLSYTKCDFATNKTGKEIQVSQIQKTNTELSKFTDNTRPSNDDKTQKSRIGLLHRNQFPEAIQLT